MPRNGYRRDLGQRGFIHQDKPLVMSGASWLEPMGSVTLWEDFLMDVLADSPFVTAASTGTALTAVAIDNTAGAPVAGHGGWIIGKTDDVAAEITEINFGGLGTGAGLPPFVPSRAGNGVMVYEVGTVMPVALTARQYYAGWTDAAIEGTGVGTLPLGINTGGVYTIADTATDAAGWVFSSFATAPTIWKYAATLNGAQSTASASTEGVTSVVDCYTVSRVEIDALGNAYFYQTISASSALGRVQPTSMTGSLALAVTPTIPLLGYFGAHATTTTGVELEMDYCFLSSAR